MDNLQYLKNNEIINYIPIKLNNFQPHRDNLFQKYTSNIVNFARHGQNLLDEKHRYYSIFTIFYKNFLLSGIISATTYFYKSDYDNDKPKSIIDTINIISIAITLTTGIITLSSLILAY